MARGLLVVAAALLLAVQVVRNAAVAELSARSPDAASRIWPGHPNAKIAAGMTEIGRAARDQKSVSLSVFTMIDDAAVKAPLSPEPFLVKGVQAQLSGDVALSTRAFVAAERRDPRSLPARYFLADHYFRAGDAQRGLAEAAALARLAPGGVSSMAPYVAAYAKDRTTWPQLRGIFSTNSDLETAALGALAADAANADAVIALADDAHLTPASGWVPILLGRLVEAGQYAKARAIWSRAARVHTAQGETVHDAAFADRNSPAPFNWELISSGVGLAERQPGGRLHVLYYGQQDGVLARQLLVLPPAKYSMTMRVAGNLSQARALTWSIRCDRVQSPFAAAPLDAIARQPWTFTVSRDCPAQWLELSAVSSDAPQQSEFTIGSLKLSPQGANE